MTVDIRDIEDEQGLVDRWRRKAEAWAAEIAMTRDTPLRSSMELARNAYAQCARELEKLKARQLSGVGTRVRDRSVS